MTATLPLFDPDEPLDPVEPQRRAEDGQERLGKQHAAAGLVAI